MKKDVERGRGGEKRGIKQRDRVSKKVNQRLTKRDTARSREREGQGEKEREKQSVTEK